MTKRSLTGSDKAMVQMFFNQAKRRGDDKEMKRLKKMYGMFLDLI